MIDAIYNCISIKNSKENFFFSMATHMFGFQRSDPIDHGVFMVFILYTNACLVLKNFFKKFPHCSLWWIYDPVYHEDVISACLNLHNYHNDDSCNFRFHYHFWLLRKWYSFSFIAANTLCIPQLISYRPWDLHLFNFESIVDSCIEKKIYLISLRRFPTSPYPWRINFICTDLYTMLTWAIPAKIGSVWLSVCLAEN